MHHHLRRTRTNQRATNRSPWQRPLLKLGSTTLTILPTPRVTGAYVETPATVRVEKITDEEQDHIKAFTVKLKEQLDDNEQDAPMVEPPVLFRDKKSSLAWRNKDQDTASEPGTSNNKTGDTVATSFPVGRKRRSRSLPRRRPPVRNSAKLPSVKDDLRELQRQHNIDDSTTDDLEEILTGQKLAAPKLEELLRDLPAKTKEESDDGLEGANESPHVKEEPESDNNEKDMSAGSMAIYDKMSQSLRTGLLGIRSAKLGIQRLEDQVAHAEQSAKDGQPGEPEEFRPHEHKKPQNVPQQTSHAYDCPDCAACPEPVAATYLHFPLPATLPSHASVSPHPFGSRFNNAVTLVWCRIGRLRTLLPTDGMFVNTVHLLI